MYLKFYDPSGCYKRQVYNNSIITWETDLQSAPKFHVGFPMLELQELLVYINIDI